MSTEKEIIMEKNQPDMAETELISSRKRKLLYSELENEYQGGSELFQSSGNVKRTSFRSSSSDPEKIDDGNGSETEISSTSINGFSSPMSSEVSGESETAEQAMDSSTISSVSNQASPVRPSPKTPSPAELEEFFAEAEKAEQKRFAEKYNYDIKEDVPLEGKYQWVKLYQN